MEITAVKAYSFTDNFRHDCSIPLFFLMKTSTFLSVFDKFDKKQNCLGWFTPDEADWINIVNERYFAYNRDFFEISKLLDLKISTEWNNSQWGAIGQLYSEIDKCIYDEQSEIHSYLKSLKGKVSPAVLNNDSLIDRIKEKESSPERHNLLNQLSDCYKLQDNLDINPNFKEKSKLILQKYYDLINSKEVENVEIKKQLDTAIKSTRRELDLIISDFYKAFNKKIENLGNIKEEK